MKHGSAAPLPARFVEHNRDQRDYFERTFKTTMVPSGTPYIRRQARAVMQEAGVAPGARVLEVGCGMGRYTLPLAEMGYRVEGLDLTPGLLDKLRAFNGGRFDIPLYAGDVVDHAEALADQFDAVVGFFTLHHVHGLAPIYAAMARMVRPGGRIVFLEPNPYNPSYYLQVLLTPRIKWRNERGILQMRRGPIFAAMRAAGLVHPSVARFGVFPPALANRPWAPPIESAFERLLGWTPCLAFQTFAATRPR